MLVYSTINLNGDSTGAMPPEILLAPSLPPTFLEGYKRMNFEYCLLKMLVNEKDVQGMNMILLDCYCALTYT